MKHILITIIYTSPANREVLKRKVKDKEKKLEKDTIDSKGHEFYNPGGIGSHPYEIYYFIKNIGM